MNASIEYRVFGPPGTGKTTYLSKSIQSAGEKHGINRIMVASFTRAAATEIAGRNRNAENIGTLHSHGYRALGGRQQIAETRLADWNLASPHYELSGGKNADVDDVQEYGNQATPGDEMFGDMQMYRSQMTPREKWKLSVRGFADRWDSWKKGNGLLDFTDMIEIPYREISEPPGNVKIGFFDESQDFTPLEFALIRKWGKSLDYIVLAGDDDQAIYQFCGARPEVMFEGDPTAKQVLSQSYRVPRAVHALAQETIQAVRSREPKEYAPRDVDGEVRKLSNVNYNTPYKIIEDLARYENKTIMILMSCSYMLNPLIKALRKEGIPFHNPYRTKAGAWNPLRAAGKGAVSSVDRLLAFVDQVPLCKSQGLWDDDIVDIDVFRTWYDIISIKENIPHGMKQKIIESLTAADPTDVFTGGTNVYTMPALLEKCFLKESGVFDYLKRNDLVPQSVQWFINNINATKARALEYPSMVVGRQGVHALREKPKIIIGTIHSVKGGEADVVYVAPDMSYAAYTEKTQSAVMRDAATRLKYVAYTRTRESLVLLDNATNFIL